jgi:hypothetical protein
VRRLKESEKYKKKINTNEAITVVCGRNWKTAFFFFCAKIWGMGHFILAFHCRIWQAPLLIGHRYLKEHMALGCPWGGHSLPGGGGC